MSTPHKCPACDGYGERPNPDRWSPGQMTTAIPPLTIACNACGGTGIIWESAPMEIPSITLVWRDEELVLPDAEKAGD